MVVCSSPFMWR